jgi:hypothetical protein
MVFIGLMIWNSYTGWFYYSYILENTTATSTEFRTGSAVHFLTQNLGTNLA